MARHRKLHPLGAFTSCRGVSALHVCAEFNSVECARLLLQAGADVNTCADVDADGMGGYTPVFHSVNSIFNYCRPMLELLTEAGADLNLRVKSLLWGESFDWETVAFDVTPISYAQCALYRQFHRTEADIYANLGYLHRKRNGPEPPRCNASDMYLA